MRLLNRIKISLENGELADLTLKRKGNSNLYSQTAVVDSGHRRVGADLYAQAFQIRKTSSGDNESTFLQTVAQTEKASGGPAGFIQMFWKMQIDKGAYRETRYRGRESGHALQGAWIGWC